MITYTFMKEELDECKLHSLASRANLEFAKICQRVSKSRAQQHVPAAFRLSAPHILSSKNVMFVS